MKILRREFFNVSRSDTFKIVPLGDVHIGSAACDEELLRTTIKDIENDPDCYWIGLGDYADFIQLSDWRRDPSTLAKWITVADLNDLSKAESERFLEFVRPISHKCLGLVKGNHEESIKRKYERDIYSEIVTGVKTAGEMKGEERLGLGYYGWLRLVFYSDSGKHTRSALDICLHHGFVGGRLAGAKALNMERFLWTHSADLVLMGHSHNTLSQKATVEMLDHKGNVKYHVRRGAFCGTFLATTNEQGASTYSERKGYLPTPTGTIEVVLQPGHMDPNKRIKIMT